MIKITENAIDVQKVIDAVASLGAGGVNIFIGNVRGTAQAKTVRWL